MKKILSVLFLASNCLIAKPVVSATILPTKYFIQKIAGNSVEVNAIFEKGADPHTYEPKPLQMKNLQKSELYFAVGVEFDEIKLPGLTSLNPNLKIIQTQNGTKFLTSTHHHNHKYNHDMPNDPHIWLDPILVKIQAENIKNALISAYPEHKHIYENNYDKFIQELDALNAYAKEKLAPFAHQSFIINHPSFGYFAKRYNLVQIPIEVDGKEPKPAELANLIKQAKQSDIKTVFTIANSSPKLAQATASQIDAKVISVDDLPLDWATSIKETIDIFAANLVPCKSKCD